jgi:voltage-gated potassium channel
VLGKVLSGVIMVLGFVLLALTTAVIASLFVREAEEPEELREQAFEQSALAELRQLNARLELIESRLPPRD